MTTLTKFDLQEMQQPYRASYPLDFALRDDQGQAVLTIALDASEHDLHLEITNVAGTAIDLLKPRDDIKAADAQNHHFELRFRPGVLALATLNKEANDDHQDDWLISQPVQKGAGSDVSFYLLHKVGRSIAPDKRISLRLTKMAAAGGGGAPGTPVELRYRSMQFAGDSTPIEGQSLFHLNLVNRMGKQQTPLRVGIVGSNWLLNDGNAANELQLRITNTGQSAMSLRNANGQSARFTLSFDADDEWGVAAMSAVEQVVVQFREPEVAGVSQIAGEPARAGSDNPTKRPGSGIIDRWGGKTRPKPAQPPEVTEETDFKWKDARQINQGGEPVWLIEPEGIAAIEPRQSFYINITNLKSSAATGQANLYLRYENVPGYWDGQFVCTLEKGPFSYDSKGNVGIGTVAPEAKVQILNTIQDANGDTLVLGPAGGANLRLGYHTNYSWIQSHGNKPLAINSVGNNVGIGTTAPTERLEVAGSIKATSLQVSEDVRLGRNFLAPSAPEKLHVVAGEVIRDEQGFIQRASGGFRTRYHGGAERSGQAILIQIDFAGSTKFKAVLFCVAQREDGTFMKTVRTGLDSQNKSFLVDGLGSFTFMAILLKE